ncbi:TPA: hypothetical protein ACHR7L_004892 [Yersinia enterocolitica]|uniref:hypothetical protein n=1 Tax=Yersinia enterocolitica TaxID=630 RepID=UPI0037689BAD|nr:hypothetical protein [Yersinia enterocolitica]
MTKLIRLASPNDYVFIDEIGLWELTFDKRPIQGVRCDDPVTGSFEYNQGRLKFRSALEGAKKPEQLLDFNAVLEWAACDGSPIQCRLVCELFNATSIHAYKEIALEFISLKQDNYPMHLDIAIFFTGFETRLTTKHDLLNVIRRRADYGKDNYDSH